MHYSKLLDQKLGEIKLVHIHTTFFLQHLLRQQPAVYVYFSQVIFCFHVDLREAERKSNFDKYIFGRSRWPRGLRRSFAAAR
jgi:hypothetical protein